MIRRTEPGGEPALPSSSNTVPIPSAESSSQASPDRVVSGSASSKTTVMDHEATPQQMMEGEANDGEEKGETHEDCHPGVFERTVLGTDNNDGGPVHLEKEAYAPFSKDLAACDGCEGNSL